MSFEVRLGTRGSALAIVQAELVAGALAARGVATRIVEVVTTGDRRRAAPDKEKWVKELELALLGISADPEVNLGQILSQDGNGLIRAAQSVLPGRT